MAGPPLIGPQWSPDGRRIAYFAAAGLAGKYVVYVIDANGGPPSRLTQEGNLEALPAWSPDGRFLYVTAGRSGSLQILKVPVDGGPPVQVTRRGGAEAAVSPDGRTIYYAKVPEMGTGLWTVPADGGDEVQLLASARFGYWALARRGIYFVDFDETPDGPRPVKFYDLGSHRITQIGTLEETVAWTTTPGFAISPDGRWLLYTNLESTEADLMLVDPFR
jgi:Tol biopolymer transport system component